MAFYHHSNPPKALLLVLQRHVSEIKPIGELAQSYYSYKMAGEVSKMQVVPVKESCSHAHLVLSDGKDFIFNKEGIKKSRGQRQRNKLAFLLLSCSFFLIYAIFRSKHSRPQCV